ncbi:MAG TPA: hypothetical protein GX736_02940 [Mogibacterium sp.]|nr:hypothetical protein [Mogibacterium sp.]
MNRKKIIGIFCVAMLCLSVFTGCVKDEEPEVIYDPDEVEEEYDNGIAYEEEEEGAELTFSESSEDAYIGTWESTSGKAAYLYGNIEITIKSDYTWKATIADEPLSGKWKATEKSIELTSELFNASLSFTDKGTLILQEDRDGEGEAINTVMTKK